MLEKYRPIVYAELWDNENRTNSFKLLTEIGYSIFVVVNEQLVPFVEGKHVTQNFIFKVN